MPVCLDEPRTDLYTSDETAWLETTADLIRTGRTEEIDFDNLAEYLSDLAKRDRREVKSRLRILLAHILKWRFQPSRRSGGWKATVDVQQLALRDLLDSGTLRAHAEKELPRAYSEGVRVAAENTNLPATSFPPDCPFVLDDLLRIDVLDDQTST